ncbi:MFS domain-containing protein [Mycena kentingensis (nom. inval.)]|nr:MFS domain-containing protein [Mycena kentingensis (nom. inval.)]
MASESATPAPLPDVRLLFGPMLIGVFLNMILYGVLIMQVLTYFQFYRVQHGRAVDEDIRLFPVRCRVRQHGIRYGVHVRAAHFALRPKAELVPPLVRYREPSGLGILAESTRAVFLTQPLLVVAVSAPIQLFFAWRIRSLTKSWWIPAVVAALALASAAGGIWTSVDIHIFKTFASKPKLHNSALLWFLSACVADVLITASLVFSLSKRKTGFSGTDGVIDKIIRMTIQTGLITAVFSIMEVISFMTLPKMAINFVFDIALTKLYANCLLSTLNARHALNTSSMSGGVSENRRNNSHGFVGNGGPATTPSGRRNGEAYVDNGARHANSSAVYELETQKAFEGYDVENGYGRAPEQYGIQVTKIVERVKDPVPHPYTQ